MLNIPHNLDPGGTGITLQTVSVKGCKMIIKLELSPYQLEILHQILADKYNSWEYNWHRDKQPETRNFVWIKKATSSGNIEDPVPYYTVTLEVEESFSVRGEQVKVPMSQLTRVLRAIGVFAPETPESTT